MRYAIISDIHANLSAFDAVLADLAAQKIDRVICLGDAVGYGPQPAEVMALVRTSVHEMLMGDHDAASAGLAGTDHFSDDARALIEFTRGKLSDGAIKYLAALPLEFKTPGFACVHADFSAPTDFIYVESAAVAKKSFKARKQPLLFAGHSHEAAVFIQAPDGTCMRDPPADFTPRRGCRYLVNPGSVGMSRAADFGASYCIFDTSTNRVTFHRANYDVQAFRNQIKRTAAHEGQAAYVLDLFDGRGLPVLDANASFPAAEPPQQEPATAQEPDKKSAGKKSGRPPTKIVVKIKSPSAAGAASPGAKKGDDIPPAKRTLSGTAVSSAAKMTKRSAPKKSKAGLITTIVLLAACAGIGIYAFVKYGQTPGTAVVTQAAASDEFTPPMVSPQALSTPPPAPVAAAPPPDAKAASHPVENAKPAAPAPDAATTAAPRENMRPGVRIVFDGVHGKIPVTLVTNSPGTTAYMAVNVKNETAKTCQAILSFVTTNTEWKQAEWVVKPEKDGMLALTAASRWNTNHFQLWMLYDDFELSGATLSQGDFESEAASIEAWQIKPAAGGAKIVRDKSLAHGGEGCLKAGSFAPASQNITVTAGQELKLTFWYRAAP